MSGDRSAARILLVDLPCALGVAAWRLAREAIVQALPDRIADRLPADINEHQLWAMLHRQYDVMAVEAYDSGDPLEAWRLAEIAASYAV